jgi:hypothetical protein
MDLQDGHRRNRVALGRMNVIILTLPASVLVQKTHIAPVVRRPTTGVVVGLRIPTVDHHALLRQGLGERFGMRRCAVLFRPFLKRFVRASVSGTALVLHARTRRDRHVAALSAIGAGGARGIRIPQERPAIAITNVWRIRYCNADQIRSDRIFGFRQLAVGRRIRR